MNDCIGHVFCAFYLSIWTWKMNGWANRRMIANIYRFTFEYLSLSAFREHFWLLIHWFLLLYLFFFHSHTNFEMYIPFRGFFRFHLPITNLSTQHWWYLCFCWSKLMISKRLCWAQGVKCIQLLFKMNR